MRARERFSLAHLSQFLKRRLGAAEILSDAARMAERITSGGHCRRRFFVVHSVCARATDRLIVRLVAARSAKSIYNYVHFERAHISTHTREHERARLLS